MKTVIELYEQRGLQAKKVASTHGGEYAGSCPGCGGTDRFRIWPAENDGNGAWWCRQCGKAGDGIQFLRDFCGMSFRQACDELDRSYSEIDRYKKPRPRGGSTDRPEFNARPSGHPQGVDPDLWRKKAAAFVDECHRRLLHEDKIMVWLGARGIDLEAVRHHQLGWHAGENGKPARWRPRRSWGLPDELKKNGQLKKLFIPRGLVIPKIDVEAIARIRIRRPKKDLENDYGKYFVVPGSDMAPMLLGPERRGFVVVEAELDAIACFAAAGDLIGAMAIGSSSAKPDAGAHKILQKSLCILAALDFDTAGAAAFAWWKQTYKQTERWPVPKGKDPGDAVKAGVDLRSWITTGLPPIFQVGPSSSEKKKKRDAVLKKPETSVESVDTGIEKLIRILRDHPVQIICNAGRCGVEWQSGWDRGKDSVLDDLSRLVFFDAQVWNYLHSHPDDVINGKNVEYETGRATARGGE